MLKRTLMVIGIVALSIAASGCTKCGFLWDDYLPTQKSCGSSHN